MKKISKKISKGFTLIELLVVVLIIGILAAVALPQYKFTVAKSKYNTIKNMTESLVQSVGRYYLATTTVPENLEVLDINIPGKYVTNNKLRVELPSGENCGFNASYNTYQELTCHTKVFGQEIAYLSAAYYGKAQTKRSCYAYSLDNNDLVNKVCQSETGKNSPDKTITGDISLYRYIYPRAN